MKKKQIAATTMLLFMGIMFTLFAQAQQSVKVQQVNNQHKIDVFIGKQLFTSFLYGDSIEKPVLYPINNASGVAVTRGFPLAPKPGDPTDHPHHLGLWLNFESVNGLDFWNNSYIIPKEKKQLYGRINTDKILQASSGKKGKIVYHSNWVNLANEVLLEETTSYVFFAQGSTYIIDRITKLQAKTNVIFKDSKDGLLGLRVAHALQIPSNEQQKFVDDKGNITYTAPDNIIPIGNYASSEGKQGNTVWGTRAKWCKMYGKLNGDSVSIVIIDHPDNINYPTFWHARGYGLFAANPLGENIFTNGASAKNLQLKNNETVSFRYRIVIDNGEKTLADAAIEQLANEFKLLK